MRATTYTTSNIRPADRYAYWADVNAKYFGDLQTRCLTEAPLEAAMRTYQVGPLRLFLLDVPPHRVWSEVHRTTSPTEDLYKLVLQIKGCSQIEQSQRVHVLHPGGWSLYDPLVPYSITNQESCQLLVLQIPRQQLRGFKVPDIHTGDLVAPELQGLSSVLGSFLASLSTQIETLSDGVGQPLSDSVIGLLTSTLVAQRNAEPASSMLPSVLRARVKQFVHAHLAEPDLTPGRIAQELRCSKRYLHRLFEEEDCTLDRFIWQRRLERCREALGVVQLNPKSISEIAFAWGFNSSAHFCRMFKSHFGEAPGEYRRRLALQLPPGTGRLPLAH